MMRHKWYSTVIAISLVALIGSINGCTTAITQQPISRPIINYFAASPPSVSQGQQITLSWNVSGATTITIQPDIGTVGPSDSLQLTPHISMTYTLTATNQAGSSINSVTLTVVPVVADKADLVITDIWLEGPIIIYYKIKNQGNTDAKPCKSFLYVNTFKEASDWVELLAAGEEITASFSSYNANFDVTGNLANINLANINLKVCADVDNAVYESDEDNNCTTKPLYWR
ncbi:MAG: autotransporter outer membrane beta-barrel domain-containing protein [Dehalococcoidia bacterium]|nr:autotransporter outer membrane beta-barrel domain-containing protein [Dehalococcoidia bacterium]